METKKQIIIYTDGSSLGNPGPGGWGAVILTNDRVVELGGKEQNTTNNRMELVAAIEALAETEDRIEDVVVYTDSSYVVNGITKWVYGWEKNDWMTSKKEPVLNKELWKRLLQAIDNRAVSWSHVSGHSGLSGNERADMIATSFAEEKKPDLYTGTRDAYTVDMSHAYDVGKREKRDASKKRSRAKAYAYVSSVDGRVCVHKTWDACEKYVKGKKGARYQKVFSKQEEDALVREWS